MVEKRGKRWNGYIILHASKQIDKLDLLTHPNWFEPKTKSILLNSVNLSTYIKSHTEYLPISYSTQYVFGDMSYIHFSPHPLYSYITNIWRVISSCCWSHTSPPRQRIEYYREDCNVSLAHKSYNLTIIFRGKVWMVWVKEMWEG